MPIFAQNTNPAQRRREMKVMAFRIACGEFISDSDVEKEEMEKEGMKGKIGAKSMLVIDLRMRKDERPSICIYLCVDCDFGMKISSEKTVMEWIWNLYFACVLDIR